MPPKDDHGDHEHGGRPKPPPPPKGPKEREIAAALTAAAVQAAGSQSDFASLDEAATAVARVYEQMFALVTRNPA
jgi:hypothetical protein